MRKINGKSVEKFLEENNFKYKDCNFFHHPVIGKEVIRFPWNNPKFRDHKYKYLGITYFDDFIMEELRHRAEDNERRFPKYYE